MRTAIPVSACCISAADMHALAADLVIDALSTVLVNEPFVITVTADGSPVAEANVIFSLGGAQHTGYVTDASGTVTFEPTTTGTLLITAAKSGYTQGSKTITVVASMVIGDLNDDGELTTADAAIALEIAAGSRPCDAAALAAADVGGDDRVTSLDALMILQAAAGSIEL